MMTTNKVLQHELQNLIKSLQTEDTHVTRQDRVLAVLAQHPDGLTAEKLALETHSALNGLYLVLRSLETQGRILRTTSRPRVYKATSNKVASATGDLRWISEALSTIATQIAKVCNTLDPPRI